MKFTVNRKCSGHARCFELAPEVYDLNDDGYNLDIGKTVEVAPGHEAAAREGADSCPETAITIEK